MSFLSSKRRNALVWLRFYSPKYSSILMVVCWVACPQQDRSGTTYHGEVCLWCVADLSLAGLGTLCIYFLAKIFLTVLCVSHFNWMTYMIFTISRNYWLHVCWLKLLSRPLSRTAIQAINRPRNKTECFWLPTRRKDRGLTWAPGGGRCMDGGQPAPVPFLGLKPCTELDLS